MRNKRGFTLPEVTASLLIVAVIAVTVGTMIVAGIKLIANNTQLYRAKQIGDGVFDIIENRISCSVGVGLYEDISEVQADITSALYFSERGRVSVFDTLERKYIPLFGDEFYGTAFVEIQLAPDRNSPDMAEVNIKVYMDEKQVYTRSSHVKVLAGTGGVITGDDLNSRNGGFYMLSAGGDNNEQQLIEADSNAVEGDDR
ncbi:MAG: type II secretion system protein [Oscillospiraceae bacterium]|nr:type II secretion system protein [Oscillospiraceae bacterium]